MKNSDKINNTYTQYNTTCPFDLSRQLGLQIHYVDYWNNIYGYYTPSSHSYLLINENLSLEKQEKACEHLLNHHILHADLHLEFCLDHESFIELEKNNNLSIIRDKKLQQSKGFRSNLTPEA